MKFYYSEYVRHCLRYYVKTLDDGKGGHPIFKNEVDKANWLACQEVLKNYSLDDIETISYIYRPGDTIADKIYLLAKENRMPQSVYWSLISNVERRIAEKRGLV